MADAIGGRFGYVHHHPDADYGILGTQQQATASHLFPRQVPAGGVRCAPRRRHQASTGVPDHRHDAGACCRGRIEVAAKVVRRRGEWFKTTCPAAAHAGQPAPYRDGRIYNASGRQSRTASAHTTRRTSKRSTSWEISASRAITCCGEQWRVSYSSVYDKACPKSAYRWDMPCLCDIDMRVSRVQPISMRWRHRDRRRPRPRRVSGRSQGGGQRRLWLRPQDSAQWL